MANRAKRPQRGSIGGAFAWRLIEMLESPAHRALTLSARKILDRLEIELCRHGGKPEQNGRLPCTYDHFLEFGVHRHAIAPAIRETVALGFVEITRQGCAGNAGYHLPTLYRLTYRHAGSDKHITDDWRQIATVEEAKALAVAARTARPEQLSKTKAHPLKPSLAPPPETVTRRGHSPPPKTVTTGPPPKTVTTSISRRGALSSDHAAVTQPTKGAATLRPTARPNGAAAVTPVGLPGPASIHIPQAPSDAPAASLQSRLDEARALQRAAVAEQRNAERKIP